VLFPFLNEAERMRAFVPPFRFTQFFSPEDTLLCMCAAEAAMQRKSGERIIELTTGSGLVGLDILSRWEASNLLALDVDPVAVSTASVNATTLNVAQRARFVCANLWSPETTPMIRDYQPELLICNPPYVPEPADGKLQIEAGAGKDGTAHLMRTMELMRDATPEVAALSWCSLANPAKVINAAHCAGYALSELFVVAIPEGEYSGSVYDYLRTLPECYIAEDPETLQQVAPDGSARFAYLLMSGVFERLSKKDLSESVRTLCRKFAHDGLGALANPDMDIPTHCWLLDRWDELRLRALLH
jgi:16S rRNA G966 N2-methylase RsmD